MAPIEKFPRRVPARRGRVQVKTILTTEQTRLGSSEENRSAREQEIEGGDSGR